MLVLHGTGVSGGISIGQAYVLRRQQPEVLKYVLPRNLIDEEIERFRQALELARTQLEHIKDHVPAGAPSEIASIIDTHLLILEDSMIAEAPISTIRKDQCNAEWSLFKHGEDLREMFGRIEDPYLRARSTDVTQVVDRIVRNLLGQEEVNQDEIESGRIIVATDLTPADTVLLKHRRIRAFVTDLGGPISHTAILARSLEIPAIVSVHNASRFIGRDEQIIVDGKRGVVIVSPDKGVLGEYRKRNKRILELKKHTEGLRRASPTTRDGVRVKLHANIELPADVKGAIKASASGIGLYRTEFLYMNREQPPTEEEQLRAYLKVVKALPKNRTVTIRTLDLGADKQVDGGARHEGAVTVNPALGLRAVRLCLQSIDLFRPQLRAILRASAHGKIKMMIPMISSLGELHRVMELIEETKVELRKEGHKFNNRIPVGGMIEVPAAAVTADLFAPHLDFLSIGTNDLIQYTLAIDRVDDAVNYLYDPLHPSILRLIDNIIRAGDAAGIPVSMCGEMAGDVRYTRLLLGMGLRELSMHPATLLPVKQIVRHSNIGSLNKFARKILRTRDVNELQALVDDANEKLNSEIDVLKI